MEILTMSQSFTNLLYHLIFSTKDRRPIDHVGISTTAVRIRRRHPAQYREHDLPFVLAKLRPDRALSDILRDLKANASGWMHDVFPRLADFSWQRGYAAFTVSQSHVAEVQKYLARQKEHHRKVSFRDEFITYLKVNGIEYDDRYV